MWEVQFSHVLLRKYTITHAATKTPALMLVETKEDER